MADKVVTELVIDADTSGADRFSQSMDRAGGSAERGQASLVGMSVALGGVSVASIAAIAGMRSFVDYVGQQSQALVDVARHAELAGISAHDFQATLFAARAAGLTEKDFVSGLDKIAADITQASQGVTDFGKLFEANGVSIRRQNGELKTASQALTDIMALAQNATPQVAQRLAQIVGVSQSWIPFLREGADQFEAQKRAASDLGVIIDDSTIAKAKEFNAEWKTAVATWDLQFKASLASILPLLTQMAGLASKIIDGIGSVSGAVGRWYTPDESKTSAQLNDQINDVYRLREMVEKLNGGGAGSFLDLKARTSASLFGLGDGSSVPSLEKVDALLDKLAALQDKRPKQVTISGGSTVLPATGGDGSDAIDRAINSLQKHIEMQNADARSVGLGAAAMARFRAEAAETAAVLANGGKETAAQSAQFALLKDRAAAAAEALARAKVANDIKFGRGTAFLSQEDVQIAGQLKAIYPNVTDALNSAEAAQLRFNSAARATSSAIENNLTTGLVDAISGAKSFGQAMADTGKLVVRALEEMLIKMLIVGPLMRAFQSSASGFSLFSGLKLPGFASGTDSAPGGLSIINEGGRGEIVNLPNGAKVIPHDVSMRMAANSNGGAVTIGDTHITVQGGGNSEETVQRLQAAVGQLHRQHADMIKQAQSSQRYSATGVG